MGHSHIPIENGLYGFKGDLKEALRKDNPPRWLHLARKPATSRAWKEAKEEAMENAERHEWSVPEVRFTIYQSRRFGGGRKVAAPEKIQEKMDVSREDAQEYTGFHHVNARDYEILVTLGERGGIQELKMARDFHH